MAWCGTAKLSVTLVASAPAGASSAKTREDDWNVRTQTRLRREAMRSMVVFCRGCERSSEQFELTLPTQFPSQQQPSGKKSKEAIWTFPWHILTYFSIRFIILKSLHTPLKKNCQNCLHPKICIFEIFPTWIPESDHLTFHTPWTPHFPTSSPR